MTDFCIILTTCPDSQSAGLLADLLIENNLAACINVISGITSHYLWEGKMQRETEYQLVIKTQRMHLPSIGLLFETKHPYDLPELVVLPIIDGNENYLTWLNTQTNKAK